MHDGPPSDSRAKDYYVTYKDYIKNVASSEIYATWPEATLTANILAIQSITLNRVYTEWYRNKGYDFTITSSTAYDQKWIPDWMRQWDSKYLGDQGYSAIEILRAFYGNSVYINSSTEISGIPSSWPGYDLTIGATGSKVLQMQQQLNVIADAYPLIPKISQDGIYGEKTANAVKIFQKIFGLPQTGVTDFPTWYKISEIYVGVSRIAEMA